ncbi:hypothetical protein NE865_02084 [Phthorimaea operculella]|nr:hypothetical protein NE865_02084 [Phthorimaea operculella]
MDEIQQEEEEDEFVLKEPSAIPVCTCLRSDESIEIPRMSERKQRLFSTVPRTEAYLRDRRIPELMRFFCTKLLADHSDHPVAYMEELLADCMLFRAGIGLPPVLYERRHLEAVVKSFDPGNRGWLSPSQVRKAFTTLGFTPVEPLEESTPLAAVVDDLLHVQEKELYSLLTAGTDLGGRESTTSAADSSATASDSKLGLLKLKPTFSSL